MRATVSILFVLQVLATALALALDPAPWRPTSLAGLAALALLTASWVVAARRALPDRWIAALSVLDLPLLLVVATAVGTFQTAMVPIFAGLMTRSVNGTRAQTALAVGVGLTALLAASMFAEPRPDIAAIAGPALGIVAVGSSLHFLAESTARNALALLRSRAVAHAGAALAAASSRCDVESAAVEAYRAISAPPALSRFDREKTGATEAQDTIDAIVDGALQRIALADDRERSAIALHQSQLQFREAQKLEAVGRLAGGMAHDFNNLLTAILSFSTLARDQLPEDDPIRADLDEIAAAAVRGSGLTRQILAFCRRQDVRPQLLDLNELISDLHRMIQRLLGEDVVLEISLDPAVGHVLADRGHIEQVLANLAVNARDAMPGGGRLAIETHASAEHVTVVVRDSGTGMTQEVRAHLFEPFFTTKGPGRGTGLGLAIVYGIVRQAGGGIDVTSQPEKGCEFRIRLPVANGTPAPKKRDDDAMPRGTETILLVEDQDLVRAAASRILRRLGYKVREAGNGGEAILLWEREQQDIDLLLSDVVMPHMSGPALALRLRVSRPSLPVLLMSGHTDQAGADIARLGAPFLPKPFQPAEIAKAVRYALDESEPPRPGERRAISIPGEA